MTILRSATLARVMLELDGASCGYLAGFEGGDWAADIAINTLGTTPVNTKHVANVRYTPLVLVFGGGMTQGFYQWIADWLAGLHPLKGGAIVFTDANQNELWRTTFVNATIVGLQVAALDTASTTPSLFTLTVQPDTMRLGTTAAGAKSATFGTAGPTTWSAANLRIAMQGLPTISPLRIDAIAPTQPVSTDTSGIFREPTARVYPSLTVPDLHFTIWATDAGPWLDWGTDWFVNGNHLDAQERTATLQFLAADGQTVLFTITFLHAGLISIVNSRVIDHAAANRTVTIGLYAEQMTFAPSPAMVLSPLPTLIPLPVRPPVGPLRPL